MCIVDVGYGIPKWTYLETSLVWILGKFCLVHGSTLKNILIGVGYGMPKWTYFNTFELGVKLFLAFRPHT
jgi:hypothetical protein